MNIKALISVVFAVVFIFSSAVNAFASEPYNPYSYDKWGDPIPSQSGYKVDRVVDGKQMGFDEFCDPKSKLFISLEESDSLNGAKDMFYLKGLEQLWIADSGNNRIICLDTKTNKVIGVYHSDGILNFSSPNGVFAKYDSENDITHLYVADYNNSRVCKCEVLDYKTLKSIKNYTKPNSELYNSKVFNPEKVLVDGADNVYTVVGSVTTGACVFSSDGEFMGFYGANRVEPSFKVVAQKFWRKIATQKALDTMQRSVPVEYKNFDIDKDGFIYTVTEAANTSTDAVKKVNAAGNNIWDNVYINRVTFGDYNQSSMDISSNVKLSTKLTDIDISDDQYINLLDYQTGRVFQYNQDCELIFIFGAKSESSNQKGSFKAPNALESVDEDIYILDGAKNDITIYTKTVFGKYVHSAVKLYEDGKYTESAEIWQEVVKRDGGYNLAYVGLGKACVYNGEYKQAMKYFKISQSRKNYDKAYEYYREQWLSEHFGIISAVIIILILLLILNAVMKNLGINLRDSIVGIFKNHKKS